MTATILDKFGIASLNRMQEEARYAIQKKSDVVLLSPIGTGKTLAFLLLLIATLEQDCAEIQLLIFVPSRELAQQIEYVTRKMGTRFKVKPVYGSHSGHSTRLT